MIRQSLCHFLFTVCEPRDNFQLWNLCIPKELKLTRFVPSIEGREREREREITISGTQEPIQGLNLNS